VVESGSKGEIIGRKDGAHGRYSVWGLLREECWSITSACVPFADLNIQTHELYSLLLPHDSSCYSN
jgi:hypothetical protein